MRESGQQAGTARFQKRHRLGAGIRKIKNPENLEKQAQAERCTYYQVFEN